MSFKSELVLTTNVKIKFIGQREILAELRIILFYFTCQKLQYIQFTMVPRDLGTRTISISTYLSI